MVLIAPWEIGEGDPTHIFATGPFSQAIKRVQVVNDEIKVYDPDAPEVTGVYMKDMKELKDV